MPPLLVVEDAFHLKERGIVVLPSFPWERVDLLGDLVIELRRDRERRRANAELAPMTLRTARGRETRVVLVIKRREVASAGIVDAGTEVWTVDDDE